MSADNVGSVLTFLTHAPTLSTDIVKMTPDRADIVSGQ